MTQEHPIAPPPELVVEWADTIYQQTECDDQRDLYVATQAARWGADQQLEQCVAWLDGYEHEGWAAEQMRNACRPKPPSLKELALSELSSLEDMGTCNADIIRRALEQFND